MSRLFKTMIFFVTVALVLASCGSDDKTKRNSQYMPDMYESLPPDTYAENSFFPNKTEAQLPVKGAISRGHLPYAYPDTYEGYEDAMENLKSPLTVADLDSEKGKKLYTIYCVVCHGKKGNGQGHLVKTEKFLGIPNYKDREITEGSIYHVLMYGKNMMGSHASQLTEKERWLVVKHVQKLRNNLLK